MDDLRRLRPGILHALDRGFFEARYARAAARERQLLDLIATRDFKESFGEERL